MGDVTVVAPIGTLIGGDETMTLHRKLEKLVEKGRIRLVVDLGGVPYLNSSGVGTLIAVRNLCYQQEGGFALTGVNPKIQNLFELLLLLESLNCHPDLAGAVSSLIST